MASLKGLTVEAVDAALKEFDAIGRSAFLVKYDFGEARGLYLVRDGKRYDSKAIVGAAIGRLPGRTALQGRDFTGGFATVVRALEKLGFTVVDERPARYPRWTAEEIILALDLYLRNGLLDDRAAEVIDLAAAINALDVDPERPDGERWRSPNRVALMLANFAGAEPGWPGPRMDHGNALDRRVLDRLKPYPDLVRNLATDIRAGVRIDLDNLPIPADERVHRTAGDPAPSTSIFATTIPIEQQHRLGKYEVSQPDPRFAERIEQRLVGRFCGFLEVGGYTPKRVRYKLDGADYFTDIVVRSARLLIEAKYHTGRSSVRMAVGQIKDYDFMESEVNGSAFASLALLLGNRPAESVLRYLAREGVGAAWAAEVGWRATDGLMNRLAGCEWS